MSIETIYCLYCKRVIDQILASDEELNNQYHLSCNNTVLEYRKKSFIHLLIK